MRKRRVRIEQLGKGAEFRTLLSGRRGVVRRPVGKGLSAWVDLESEVCPWEYREVHPELVVEVVEDSGEVRK